VVDFRGIPIMAETGCPVVMDITHSLQQPNQGSGVTGGLPQFIAQMARCAIVSDASGIFLETHPDPSKASSDGANMLPLAPGGISCWKNLLHSKKRVTPGHSVRKN
jgi:2-dehydro-3-deoxyphosphooctonate aldolase (KDO 8-P synthase)